MYKLIEKNIEPAELEEYINLLEKVMSFKVLNMILDDSDTIPQINKEKLKNCKKERVFAVEKLDDWWKRMQNKYRIVSNNKLIKLDFDRNKIIYYDKGEEYAGVEY